ncbi:MAG: CHASE2 domain-containing protein [Thermoflexibacteraceae bacterium]|jgi:CHASE2 domain-containing sensor protein
MFKNFFKSFFNWINFFGTVSVFGIFFLLQQVVVNLDFQSINVVSAVMADYKITDVVFSQRIHNSDDEVVVDSNIVVVNIGNLKRDDLAQEIMVLNKYNPKVIALDITFKKPKLEEQDSVLEVAFSQTKNLVLGTVLENDTIIDNTIYWQHLTTSIPRLHQHADAHGFVNTISTGKSQFETWRETAVQENILNKNKEYSFAVAITKLVNPTATEKFLQRNKEYEIINYTGNISRVENGKVIKGKYLSLSTKDVMTENFEPELIKDKIILMCYLGEPINGTTWDDDKYYTSMNKRPVGRTHPDMYGGVGHANIISMILADEPIDEMPEWFDYIVAVLLCYINVVIFSAINFSARLDIWYGLLTKIIQITEALLITYLIVFFFANYRLKLDFSLTITAILLAGDVLEIYYHLFLTLFEKAKLKVKTYITKLQQAS